MLGSITTVGTTQPVISKSNISFLSSIFFGFCRCLLITKLKNLVLLNWDHSLHVSALDPNLDLWIIYARDWSGILNHHNDWLVIIGM